MKKTETSLPGVLLLEPCECGDERGFFLESYNERVFAELSNWSARRLAGLYHRILLTTL